MGSCDFQKVLVSACSVFYPTQSHDIGPRVKALRAAFWSYFNHPWFGTQSRHFLKHTYIIGICISTRDRERKREN